MGECNVAMEDVPSFFEDHGDALHLQLAFLINQRLWLGLARGEAAPLESLIRELPLPPRDCGWATFLRNHDELTLDKLTGRARRGVRRVRARRGHADLRSRDPPAAASMLGGDGPRLRMAWSLMMSLPGSPVILYGDEIGMGEDLGLDGRMAVRTPMQWAPGPGAGFSAAPAERLVRPVPRGPFGPDAVSVWAQRRTEGSLLKDVTRLVHARRAAPELGLGTSRLLENDPAGVFAHRCDWQGSTVFTVHNLSGEPAVAELDLGRRRHGRGRPARAARARRARRAAAGRAGRLRVPVAARAEVRAPRRTDVDLDISARGLCGGSWGARLGVAVFHRASLSPARGAAALRRARPAQPLVASARRLRRLIPSRGSTGRSRAFAAVRGHDRQIVLRVALRRWPPRSRPRRAATR